MNNFISILSKKVGSNGDNNADLLFNSQNIWVNTFAGLLYFSSSSFNLRKSNNIDFSNSIPLKTFFNE